MTEVETAPDAGASGKSWEPARAPFVAALLVLLASFANFLSYHEYPMLRPEVAMIGAIIVAAAAIFAAAHRSASDFGKAVLDGFLVYLAVDLNSEQILVAAAAAMVVAFLRLGRGVSLLGPLAIVSLVVLASSFTGLTESRAPIATVKRNPTQPANDRPAVLHLILDEHGGVGGNSDPEIRQQLRAFYASHGFRLFERAYSRHFHTVNAIPDVLNYGHPGESKNVSETLDIGRTAYLSGLERKGYRLHFYQSDFADFCRYSRFATCTNYWSPSMAFIAPMPLPAGEKARLLGLKFTALSSLLQAITGGIDDLTHLPMTRPLGIPVMAIKERAASGSLGGFAALDQMAKDLASAQPGNAYFAHILAPHFPYVMGPDCKVMKPSAWEYRRSSRPVAARETAYKRQLGCLLGRLDKTIAAFLASPAGRDGVIIIHGDHGTRITAEDPIEPNEGKLSPADLMAAYSTLFAVRAPGLPAGSEVRPFATPDILNHLARSDFSSLDGIPAGNGRVHLDGPSWSVGKPTSIANAWPEAD